MTVDKTMIRDRNGKILGHIVTDQLGNKTVKDFYGRIVGRFIKNSNLTKDFYGRIIAQGDVTAGLLYRK